MNGYLMPLMEMNTSFRDLMLSEGIYLTDLRRKGLSEPTIRIPKSKKNVGAIMITKKLKRPRFRSGYSTLDLWIQTVLLFVFLKTRKSVQFDSIFKISINERSGKIKKIEEIDSLSKLGIFPSTIKPFLSESFSLITKKDLETLRSDRKYFKRYPILIKAELHPWAKSPLGSSISSFMSGFNFEIMDASKLILLIAAFEALFSNSATELSFRLSHNASAFLYPQQSYKKRLLTMNEMKRIYNLRSRVVHGEYINVEDEEDITAFALNIFCNCIIKVVESRSLSKRFLEKNSHSELIRELESGRFV